MAENKLYYGDNLDVLRRYVPDDSVDLVYLDPPFKSNRDYNALFQERNSSQSAAQIKAFEDTWRWDMGAEEAYTEVVEAGGGVSRLLQGTRQFLGENDMMAYLAMMAPRLLGLRRVLKPTGSIYLHCDPTASAHLRLLMDAVFGAEAFRTEIIWKRSSAHSDTKQGRRQHGRIHDSVLFYAKSSEWTWNPQYTEYDQEYVDAFYRHVEAGTGRRYQLGDLTAAKPGGDTEYEWKGRKPYKGRYWAYSKANMEEFERQGRLCYTRTGMARYKRYLDEMPGVPLQDIWTDIKPIGARAAERLGYPTQKPEALLQRIIKASSNEGDMVLDPCCGCGTAVVAAQKLSRKWIGIDITHLAITLIKHRLHDAFPDTFKEDEGMVRGVEYDVVGEPPDVAGAAALARQDPYQFQFWALGLLGARPREEKKGADRGIDGRLYFHDEKDTRKTKQIILQVKAGHTGVKDVRDLVGVVDREKAQIGVLISLQEPTRPMRTEAAAAGFYSSPWWEKKFPRIQLLTVGEILRGARIQYPPRTNATFRRAPRAKSKNTNRQLPLAGGNEAGEQEQ